MATYGWRQGRSVKDGLFGEGYLFEFDQAMRLLELAYPDGRPVAEGVHPDREVVELRSELRFDFPASEVEQIERIQGQSDGVAGPSGNVMSVNVMGLAGLGPLPAWVSELALHRSLRGDHAFAAFLDLFNRRLLSLLYRARKKYRPALDVRSPHRGRVAACLFALMGLGTPHTRDALGIPDRALLPWAGVLTMKQRSMIGLERMVSGHFGVPAAIVPFRGLWLKIEERDTTRIGRKKGRHQVLGRGAMVGKRVWDPEASFEVRLGPLTREQFAGFLPGRFGFRSAVSLIRFYTNKDVGFTLRLVLRSAEIPELHLSRSGGAKLGRTSWLHTRPRTGDDEQVTLKVYA